MQYQGEPGDDFYMKLCVVDRDPIRRVVRESVRIKNAREREDEGGGMRYGMARMSGWE